MGDEELVGWVTQGDDRALSELYDRYSRPVYATGIGSWGMPTSRRSWSKTPSPTSGEGRYRSTQAGRASQPGSIRSPATGPWTLTGGGGHSHCLPERSRFETCP